MKKWKMLMLTVAMMAGVTACSKETATKEVTERVPGEAVEYTGSDYETIAESKDMLLKLKADTGTIRWENKSTGEYVDSNLADISGITDSTAMSDIVADYYSGTDSDKYGTVSTMDSYTYATSVEGGLTFEKIDNGVRMVYNIGSDMVTYKNFPTYIAEDRMNDLVLQYLDQKQTKTVLKQYRLTKGGLYSRKATADHPLSGMAAPELYKLFYEIGHYTEEELIADSEANDTMDELPEAQHIDVTTDVYLEDGDLIVRVPTGEIQTTKDYPLKSIDVMPYLLSSDSEDGYMFVPDGSGAIINLDNAKLSEYQFSSRYYNGDLLQNATTYNSYKSTMMLPVYGIKEDNHAVLGIIEQGAEAATLEAYVNGYFSGVPYSRVSLNFAIREDQSTATYTGATTNYTLRRVSGDFYTDDIKIRYRFLTGDDANYAGMANSYREYLIANGSLKETAAENEAPFFVDVLGEIDKEKYMLGIPYDGTQVLTTFKQAQKMVDDMTGNGIKNIKMQYEGIANAGLNQRAVEKVKIASDLGGKSGLKDLSDSLEAVGGSLFPSFKLQTASTAKDLSKKERSYFITEQIAEIYDFDIVNKKAEKDAKFPTYIISPKYIESYINKFSDSYNTLGIKNIASTDLMTFISADYKKGEELSMTNAMPAYKNAVTQLGEKYELMLSNPMADAYGQASYITDLPTKNSDLKTLDASVPFMQIVLNGCVEYSTETINTSSADITKQLMKAIETKSNLKFRFMKADTAALQDTLSNDVFMAEYSLWKDEIGAYYSEYNEFYQKVKDAQITGHELVDRNEDTVIVTYSNGVRVYLNYSDEAADIGGVKVAANSYVVK